MKIKPGAKVKETKTYKCDKCGLVRVLTEGEKAPSCEICSQNGKKSSWIGEKSILFVSRDVNKEFLAKRSWSDRFADEITAFCGNMWFVYVHIIWFGFWILANTGVIPGIKIFDPYPFGFLTLVVSLEAILLATFILISQNRQGEITEMRSELDYQTDRKTEKRVIEILELVKDIFEIQKKNKKK